MHDIITVLLDFYWVFRLNYMVEKIYYFHFIFCNPVLSGDFPLKSPWVSRTLQNILADFNSAVVWMVSILFLISISSSLAFVDCLMVIKHSWYHCYLYVTQLFQLSSKVKVSVDFPLAFLLILWPVGTAKFTCYKFFLFCQSTQVLVFWFQFGDPFLSQNKKNLIQLII